MADLDNTNAYTAVSNPAPGVVSPMNSQKWLIVRESWPGDPPVTTVTPLWDQPAAAGQPGLGFNGLGAQVATQGPDEALSAFRDRVQRLTNRAGSIRYRDHASRLPGYWPPASGQAQ